MNKHWPHILLSYMCLAGCTQPFEDIKDNKLKDRILACGAGLSEENLLNLQANYNPLSISGNLSGDFKEKAKVLIFNEVPPENRLKAYEDYIKCIEDWNEVDLEETRAKSTKYFSLLKERKTISEK